MSEQDYELERFVEAQDSGETFERALEELRSGRKTSHWMWFVFPQITGLGKSPNARTFAIRDLDEARAYVEHPVLGDRLREAARVMLDVDEASAERVLGPVDAMKLRSSMTLFAAAAPEEPLFSQVLDRWFSGVGDPETERRI